MKGYGITVNSVADSAVRDAGMRGKTVVAEARLAAFITSQGSEIVKFAALARSKKDFHSPSVNIRRLNNEW